MSNYQVAAIVLVCLYLAFMPNTSSYVPQNCQELGQSGSYNDPLLVDPDGLYKGVEPFYVECEVIDGKLTGRTIITPTCNLVEDVNGYEPHGSFVHDITYEMSITQIVALMESSTSCRQYIKYDCTGSIAIPYGFWVSRNGSTMYNWGTPTGFYGCACGYRGDCSNPSKVCECNINDNILRKDEGYIDDISTLPVMELRHGDTGHSWEYGISTIGPIECSGLKRKIGLMYFFDNIFMSEYVIITLPYKSLLTCLRLCQLIEECQSISVNDLMSCSLNSQSARKIPKSKINRDDHYKHYEYIKINK
ncbi:contactin-associated protein-like 2 [Antedon mediterranea]|uniref:contactin-associated protein-like 2 n=1 Tax=Antedon mediterranea TaxID=105859 RepID=UPI003AF9E109